VEGAGANNFLPKAHKPIFTSFSRSVVRDQCSTSFGKVNLRLKLARL
jgi:hypothetical protein